MEVQVGSRGSIVCDGIGDEGDILQSERMSILEMGVFTRAEQIVHADDDEIATGAVKVGTMLGSGNHMCHQLHRDRLDALGRGVGTFIGSLQILELLVDATGCIIAGMYPGRAIVGPHTDDLLADGP